MSSLRVSLTLLTTMSHFCTPWKRQKTKSFLTFSGGIEKGHWRKKGEPNISEGKILWIKILTSYEFFISKLHPKIFGLSTWFFTTFIHEIYWVGITTQLFPLLYHCRQFWALKSEFLLLTQLIFACSKPIIETQEKGVKHIKK